MQYSIIDMALTLLDRAWQPRTTVQAPFSWSEDDTWRNTFMHVSKDRLEEYKKLGEARRAEQAKVKWEQKK